MVYHRASTFKPVMVLYTGAYENSFNSGKNDTPAVCRMRSNKHGGRTPMPLVIHRPKENLVYEAQCGASSDEPGQLVTAHKSWFDIDACNDYGDAYEFCATCMILGLADV